MGETLESHFHNWFGVVFFALLYGAVLFFMPFYKKMDKKPAGTYLAFVLAFAVEMHGIPFSMYFLSLLVGRTLPEGILWGHTLNFAIGFWGMYLNIALSLCGLFLILNGWYHVYHKYWSREKGAGRVVETGIYRYIRHPQYAGLFLMTLGMLLEWATLPLLLLFPVIILMYVHLAKREEKDMEEEFGEEYKNYKKRTKMFIPFVV